MPRIAPKSEEGHALEKLGDAIRTKRRELNLSQEALADAAGINRTHMGEVERGKRNVSFLAVVRIATAMNVKPSDFIAAAGL